jgi:hypothetical protein
MREAKLSAFVRSKSSFAGLLFHARKPLPPDGKAPGDVFPDAVTVFTPAWLPPPVALPPSEPVRSSLGATPR